MRAGALAGGGAAAWTARKQTLAIQLVETLGGVVGGVVGARMPDVIDPPTCWNHRSVGHGIAPIGAAATTLSKMLTGWQEKLRARANAEHHQYEAAKLFLAKARHLVISLLCRLASGALVGFVAGYLSHLAMDFTTPAGLPIFA